MSKQPFIDQLDDAISRMLAHPDEPPSSVDASLAELIQLARDLRELPNPEFKGRLKASLERKISMSTKTVATRPGFRTVTPYLLPPNADFVDFLKNVFGAEETLRATTSPTSFHSEVKIGDSMLMIGVGSGRSMPTALHIYVPNADEVYQRALTAGCKELTPMLEDHGDRFGCVEDPTGNQLYIAKRLSGNYIPENLNAVNVYFHPKEAGRFIDFLGRAFGAQQLERHDSSSGEVQHAKIRIGDSVVEVGEARGWWQPMPTMLYVYVQDVDESYERALRAGAKSLQAPADQNYGDRNGGVSDEWGNYWFLAAPL